MEVYVITSPELGWDCVCKVCLSLDSLKKYLEEVFNEEPGTYSLYEYGELVEMVDESDYIIHIRNAT